ncbi:putative type III effector protein [Xanthomonas translucens pv. phlei]|uniref:Putative type III effector protein n=2 Tax=Xanthomonas translucens group TaxID=3390202 RepID=A0A0K2ZG61_9XANT|nr:type III effector protein XopP [Xanthomonas translucens]CTP83184.1 putative type III effector protein [Xanthomonas translucens pv. phlei]
MPGADLVSAMQQFELSNASSNEISQKQQELYKAIAKAQFLHSTYLNNAHNPDAKEELAPADQLRFTDNAINSAKEGLETFAYLKARHGLQEENAWKLESQLLTLLGRAATVGYLACEQLMEEKWKHELRAPSASPYRYIADVRLITPEMIARQKPEEWRGHLQQIDKYRATMDEFVNCAKATGTSGRARDQLKPVLPVLKTHLGCSHESMQAIRSMLIEIYMLRLERQVASAETSDMHAFKPRMDELREAQHYLGDAVPEAAEALNHAIWNHSIPLLIGAEVTPQVLAKHMAVMEDYAEHHGRVGSRLCLDVAAFIEDDKDEATWRTMLDLAQALTEYRQCLLDLCRAAGGGGRPAEPQPATALEEQPAQSAPEPARKARKSRGKRATAGPSTAPASAAAAGDTRTPAQRQADTLLKSVALEPAMVHALGADFIQIAKRLGKDTGNVEKMLRDADQDAATAFDFVRGSVQGWFGSSEQLRQATAKLPADDPRIGALNERLQVLQLIEQRVRTREVDALKCDTQPRSVHLARLLAMKEIAQVAAPIRLVSDADSADCGTLFEVRIDHKPLSDGQCPAPWFVHLHTARPVTANALASLDYKTFSAVHLKTAKEKNLGKRWEALMQALGHTDAKVHRATIGSDVLGMLLQARAGADAAPGQAPRRP